MVPREDIVLAVLGASAALAGLVLVFLGLVAAATASYSPGTAESIIAKARRPAYAVLGSFGLGIACVALCALWLLLSTESGPVFWIAIVLFFAQLFSLVVATVWAVKKALWE
jgi:hypothetical protein